MNADARTAATDAHHLALPVDEVLTAGRRPHDSAKPDKIGQFLPKDLLQRFNLVPGLVPRELSFETFEEASRWLESFCTASLESPAAG